MARGGGGSDQTVRFASAYLGISAHRVRGLIKSGVLAGALVAGQFRIDEDALIAYKHAQNPENLPIDPHPSASSGQQASAYGPARPKVQVTLKDTFKELGLGPGYRRTKGKKR
jgi:excisionase family DNA binding protein